MHGHELHGSLQQKVSLYIYRSSNFKHHDSQTLIIEFPHKVTYTNAHSSNIVCIQPECYCKKRLQQNDKLTIVVFCSAAEK